MGAPRSQYSQSFLSLVLIPPPLSTLASSSQFDRSFLFNRFDFKAVLWCPPGSSETGGASLWGLGSRVKVWWCMRPLVKLDRRALKKITTSSCAAVFHHGVTREKLVMCNYRSRLQMFKRVCLRHFSPLWWGHLCRGERCGLLSEEPATKRKDLANVCHWLAEEVDTMSAFISIKIAPSKKHFHGLHSYEISI